MKLYSLINAIEKLAPANYQESYDNAGLIIGNANDEISKALIAVDVTEEVLDEAILTKSDLIISHHPIIFGGLKKLNGKNNVERIVIKAIKNNIAIYAAHTNLDNVLRGTNMVLSKKLGIKNLKVLLPTEHKLLKLVVFCPTAQANKLREAIFEAGAGEIGNYDHCSFSADGIGSFRAGKEAKPFVGEVGQNHNEKEVRIETIFPENLKENVIAAMLKEHPYEEVAYDIYLLENNSNTIGAGIIGNLEKEVDAMDFLLKLKKITDCHCIKHTKIVKQKIQKVAICGGSGAFLIKTAIRAKADIYITGDIKYHDFFDAEDKLIVADIGHYESEVFTKEILYDLIKENFPTFAVRKSGVCTNPVNYL